MTVSTLPVAIIGAGPVGLAAAAHVLARGETPIVLEAGPAAGHAVRQWHHVQMFTPWQYCVDRQAAALLATRGWKHPPLDDVPTGGELVARYLEPLAAALATFVRFNARVVAVTRLNSDKVRTAGREALPFVLRIAEEGTVRTIMARAVIDASGTWFSPNPAGADGLPAIGEAEAAERIVAGIPDVLGTDRSIYAGRTTAVVGSGHSALNALIELAALREVEPGTRILWMLRKENIEAAFGGEAADALPERGELGIQGRALVESGAVDVVAPFRVASIGRTETGGLHIAGDHAGKPAEFTADRMIVATGFRPDLAMLREVRLALDPWLECAEKIGPLIDPNEHSCGTVRPHGAVELAHPDKDFYIAGIKSYGRAPTFLLATGHEQVRSIAAALAGDMEAARRVELDLPETGVCSSQPTPRSAVASSCCGGPAPAAVDACCASDATTKAAGEAGCGCAPEPEPVVVAACCGAKREAVA
ncbi:NAD(P)-binding domain-containing protein [Sphingomonas sp.]|uniref:NAD(P)-binding domain-containing protein n=1 Tax=Sphingomonas sp. TaxID=28214 RepID=UPI0035B329A3